MKKSLHLLVSSASLLLSLGAAVPAAAALPVTTETVTRVVRFQDLDIATAVGAEALYGRILSASRFVCREAPATDAHACRGRAVDVAVADVGSPLLTSIHRGAAHGTEGIARR